MCLITNLGRPECIAKQLISNLFIFHKLFIIFMFIMLCRLGTIVRVLDCN